MLGCEVGCDDFDFFYIWRFFIKSSGVISIFGVVNGFLKFIFWI